MFDLFETKRLFQIVSDDKDINVELAAFAQVKFKDDHLETNNDNHSLQKKFISEFNLVLYCSDYRILLYQFGSWIVEGKTIQESLWRDFIIPLDDQKGHIVAMCFDNAGTRLLAITNCSIIYQIPFHFKTYYDRINDCDRTVIEEDASLIRSCSLKGPTSLTWWQRDSHYVVERRSIAIASSETGNISMVDLETDQEFRKYFVPFAIRSLNIYEEMYSRSLLITCYQGIQYQLILEKYRNSSSQAQQCTKNFTLPSKFEEVSYSSENSLLLTNFNNYYLSCLLSLPFENEHDVLAKTPSSSNDVINNDPNNDTNFWKPQIIIFNNEIDMNRLLEGNKSPDNQNATTVASEFFFFIDDLNSTSTSPSTPKTILYPQTTSKNIYVVKHLKSKIKLTPSLSSSTGSSGHEADEDSIDSDDLNDFFLVKTKHSFQSSQSDFLNISMCYDQILLEIYEYPIDKFCTKTILLSSAKLFLISLNSKDFNADSLTEYKTNLIRLIDCGPRFLLLVFPDRCFLVAKTFAEQTKSSTSPRSPLLLKKSNSNCHRPSGGIGSFRRKNHTTSKAPTMSVIDEFRFDVDSNEFMNFSMETNQIIDAFLISSGSNCLGIREYLQQKLPNLTEFTGLDLMTIQERKLIEMLLNRELDDLITIDERFLIITKRSVYLIESREKSFGKFFHSELESYLVKMKFKQPGYQDGDIITRAKLMVECFAGNRGQSLLMKDSPQHQLSMPNQSWQLWLYRSALLLMRSIYKHPDLLELPEEERTQILSLDDRNNDKITFKLMEWIEDQIRQVYRLFELSRCSRRRVITSLNLFHFWSRSIEQLKKFFETRILFELNNEERTYLSTQLFESLLSIYKFYLESKGLKDKQSEKDFYNLYNYFYEYRKYYDFERILQKLIDSNLWDMAEYLALLNGDYIRLVEFILRKYPHDQLLPVEINQKILYLLTSRHVTYALILSTEYLSGCRSISLIESYLKFLFAHLPQFNIKFLHRLSCVFDPSRLSVRLLLNQTLFYCNQTYLYLHENNNSVQNSLEFDSSELAAEVTSDSESSLITSSGRLRKTLLPIKRRDLLNLHIFIQLLYLKNLAKYSKITLYDWSFIKTVTTFIPNHLKNYDSILMDHYQSRPTESAKNNKKNDNTKSTYLNWHVEAGTYCSLVYNSDHFYIWGKFDYTYSYSEQFLQGCFQDGFHSNRLARSSSTDKIKSPTLNRFFSSVINTPIKSISIGHQHMIIRTDFGIYGLGSSSFGQLGLGSKVLYSRYPALLDFASTMKIWKVVCGSYHTLILADDGLLYSFGWGLHGQLGHGCVEDEYEPKLIRFFIDVAKVTVSDVAAGYSHTVALTSTGTLYVFGENSYGQLGIKPDLNQSKSKFSLPQKFCLLDEPIRLICCGLFHTAVITSISADNQNDQNIIEKLYCWGIDPKTWRLKMRSDRTSMAINHANHFKEHQSIWDYAKIREISLSRLNGQSYVKKMMAGQSHTLLLTNHGYIYAFGYGCEGQFSGRGQVRDEAIPIMEDQQRKYIDIACGAVHSLALDFDGNVWGWGQTSQYQLASMVEDGIENNEQELRDLESYPLQQSITRLKMKSSINQDLITNQSSSIINQMIWSSSKNFRCSPSIILLLDKNNKGVEKNISFDDFTAVATPKIQWTELPQHQSELLRQQILLIIIYNRYDLNFKSLYRRFEQLELYQLSSLIAWISNDYALSLRFQLEALDQENLNEKSAIISEVSQLLSFYMSEILSSSNNFSPSVRSESTLKMVRYFILFWKKILRQNTLNVKPKDFVQILENVYFKNSNIWIINPYFGLQLLCLIKEDDDPYDLRLQLGLNDQVLIQLVERTESLIKRSKDNPIVTLQELLDRILNVKSIFQCSNIDDDDRTQRSILFPLEVKWERLISTFNNLNQKSNSLPGLNDNNTNDELEVYVPSDIEDNEDDDESLLLVFRCGHYMSKVKFFTTLTQLIEKEDNPEIVKKSQDNIFQSFHLIYQKLFTAKFDIEDLETLSPNKIDSNWLNDQIKHLNCLDCCLSPIGDNFHKIKHL